jgi:hypothetical protein
MCKSFGAKNHDAGKSACLFRRLSFGLFLGRAAASTPFSEASCSIFHMTPNLWMDMGLEGDRTLP